jgi:hypothetical protein
MENDSTSFLPSKRLILLAVALAIGIFAFNAGVIVNSFVNYSPQSPKEPSKYVPTAHKGSSLNTMNFTQAAPEHLKEKAVKVESVKPQPGAEPAVTPEGEIPAKPVQPLAPVGESEPVISPIVAPPKSNWFMKRRIIVVTIVTIAIILAIAGGIIGYILIQKKIADVIADISGPIERPHEDGRFGEQTENHGFQADAMSIFVGTCLILGTIGVLIAVIATSVSGHSGKQLPSGPPSPLSTLFS